MSKTILVTGGLGYIGGRLSKYLLEHTDYSVIISSRNQLNTKPEWLKSESAKLIKLDLLNQDELFEACQEIDCIIHLAALNDYQCKSQPWQNGLIVNGLGTLNLLQAAIQMKVSRIIYISTAHVYGAPLIGSLTEDTLPKPVTSYAISHKIAEDYLRAAHQRGDITGIVLRLSNAFGIPVMEHQDCWNLIVNDLCRQAMTTGELKLRTSGLQQRNFIPITDVCHGIAHFINLPEANCQDGLFNLGSEKSDRVMEMAQLVAERCQKRFKFQPEIKTPQGQPEAEKSDLLDYQITKLQATGFEPIVTDEQEIDATLIFCQKAFR